MEFLAHFTSSSIASIGYDPENKILHIRFVGNDAEYEYENVPQKKWKALKEADSKGQYVNFHIKPFHKVRGPA